MTWRRLVILVALATLAPAGAIGQDSVRTARAGRHIYVGVELAELAQNSFRNLGIHNYSLLVGQRFWTPGRERLGWRLLSYNVELSEAHLADSGSVCCIKGNRVGLTGRETVERLYLDFHVVDLAWKKLIRFTPVVSVGFGYTYLRLTNTRFNADWSFGTPVLAVSVRPQIMLFNTLFSEYLTLELNLHFRRRKASIGDTSLDYPEYVTVFGWHPVGVRIPFE